MSSALDGFETGFHRLNSGIATLVGIAIGLWAILIPLNLLLVRMEWGNMPWLIAIIEYSLYAGVFLGAPWVLQVSGHVRVDVLIGGLSDRAGRRLELFIDLFGALLCTILVIYGVMSAVDDFQLGEVNDKYVPLPGWQLLIVYILAFAMLAIEFLIRARHAFDEKAPVDPGEEAGF
jgi:TRAP-type mannitol/chloroaromatic compound transport system permease small subunit